MSKYSEFLRIKDLELENAVIINKQARAEEGTLEAQALVNQRCPLNIN